MISLLTTKPIQSTFTRRESVPVPAEFWMHYTDTVQDAQHTRTAEFLGRCPLCRGANIIHPGKPPGKDRIDAKGKLIRSTYNRCAISQLSGKSGQGKSAKLTWSYWNPKRKTGLCDFPLTDASGEIVPHLPWAKYRDFTHIDFSVKELRALVL